MTRRDLPIGSPNGYLLVNGHATANGHSTTNGDLPPSDSHQSYPSSINSTANNTAPVLPIARPGDLYDLVCVGFGPASMAIAVAIHDMFEHSAIPLERRPKVAFIERQANFAWHAGMQLPGARMQITFVKDFATQRNPRSRFTFLNYLWSNDRLTQFTNLNTFRPSRIEYQDYMYWIANAFKGLVHYGQEITEISASQEASGVRPVESFNVAIKDVRTGQLTNLRSRHIVISAGGRPNIPVSFMKQWLAQTYTVHSSQYMTALPNLLPFPERKYRIAVVGGGQSGAEIFDHMQTAYPNAQCSLIIKGSALRPCDDSPFVNEIFNPTEPSNFYHRTAPIRASSILSDRSTNYGVVRLELIESIYNKLYHQALAAGPGAPPRNRILRYRTVIGLEDTETGVVMRINNATSAYEKCDEPVDERLEFDAVVLATGYVRDLHEGMLRPLEGLLDGSDVEGVEKGGKGEWRVDEKYRVLFPERSVDGRKAGIWLQGCNEKTHGLSDSILSTLATRGGGVVESIFGGQ